MKHGISWPHIIAMSSVTRSLWLKFRTGIEHEAEIPPPQQRPHRFPGWFHSFPGATSPRCRCSPGRRERGSSEEKHSSTVGWVFRPLRERTTWPRKSEESKGLWNTQQLRNNGSFLERIVLHYSALPGPGWHTHTLLSHTHFGKEWVKGGCSITNGYRWGWDGFTIGQLGLQNLWKLLRVTFTCS